MKIFDFQKKKQSGEKIAMVTCYDHWTAKILNQSEVDTLLVGDSCAMVMHGYGSTLQADLEMLVAHVRSVALGAPRKFVVADMPFLSFRKGKKAGISAAEKLMKAGAHAVKIEGAKGNLKLIGHLVESGIPVMGHLGLTPQLEHCLGGYRLQGRDQDSAKAIFDQAKALEKAGCFSVVLECIPSVLGREVTESLSIPTIGIGAGADVSGQVLVLQDLLGGDPTFHPKFLRKFANIHSDITDAVNTFSQATKSGGYPSLEEGYE